MIDVTEQSAPWIGQQEYDLLCAPFANIQKLNKGGVLLDYVAAEDVVTRLNTVLGVAGWSFDITDQGYNEWADTFWALGKLTVARIDAAGNIVPVLTRMQFGAEQCKRRADTKAPLDIGFDMKAAATDAMKKCASLIGVGLYLSHKEAPVPVMPRMPVPPRPVPAGSVPPAVVAQLPPGNPSAGAAVERLLAEDANQPPPPEPVDEEVIPFEAGEPTVPVCACGLPRERRSGVSAKNGKPWAAWMCTNDDKARRCDPEWVRD